MKYLFSSVGKKIQIALTGIFLSVFLIFHLMNNLVLFSGPENFNNMVHFLEGIKPIIRVMEAGLVFILCVHIINALMLTFSNRTLTAQYQHRVVINIIKTETQPLYGISLLIQLVLYYPNSFRGFFNNFICFKPG